MPPTAPLADNFLAPTPVASAPASVRRSGRKDDATAIERRPAGILVFLLLATPAIWLAHLMYGHAVDVPWGDHWDATRRMFEKMQAGTLGLADFFAFHNEHRILFPRLLVLPLAKLTGWNVRAEAALIWVLACVCALNVWRISVATGFRGSRQQMWLLLGAFVLLFTPLQWENLLWGFQVGFFLPLAFATALPWVACAPTRPVRFGATIALCLATTFSIASGFTAWLLAAPVLLFCGGEKRTSRREKLIWFVWAAIGVLSVLAYFHGYKRPDLHPNQFEAFQHPLLVCQFLLAYMGNPFAFGTVMSTHTVAQLAGAVLLALFAAVLCYLWRWRADRELISRAVPWASLAGITLLNGGLTMFGRIGYGVAGAIQSRYVSFAVMLPIGLIFLGAIVATHVRQRDRRGAEILRVSMAACAAAFAVLLFFGTAGSLRYWRWFQSDRLTAKAVLLVRDIVDEPNALKRYIHWAGPSARGWADNMEDLGYLRPARLRSGRIREIAAARGSEQRGAFHEFAAGPDGKFNAAGWAILPERGRSADSVLLAYDNGDDDPIIFARADVRGLREDIVALVRDDAYRNCGWSSTWRRTDLPPGARQISAWAVDAEARCAYPLGRVNL